MLSIGIINTIQLLDVIVRSYTTFLLFRSFLFGSPHVLSSAEGNLIALVQKVIIQKSAMNKAAHRKWEVQIGKSCEICAVMWPLRFIDGR